MHTMASAMQAPCQAQATRAPHARVPLRPVLALPRVHRKLHFRRPAVLCTAEALDKAEAPAAEAPAAAEVPAAAEAPATPAEKAQPDLSAEWDQAVDWFKKGEMLNGKIIKSNAAGVNIRVGKLLGFIPYKLLDPARVPPAARATRVTHPQEGYKPMLGKPLKFKITQINVPERRLVCSERAAMLDELATSIKAGDVLQGRITAVRDFGAFVEVKSEGKDTYGAEVLLPLREISWDWIPNTAAALSLGQEITCVVTSVQGPPKTKVYVSLKRLQEDPLRQTLDKVMPLDGAAVTEVPTSVPSGVEDILDELSKEAGIAEVALGRQAEVQHTVSQDLELWLTKEEVAGGFNLVARAGRVVQEIHVKTQLSKDDMKAAVQRVLSRLV